MTRRKSHVRSIMSMLWGLIVSNHLELSSSPLFLKRAP